MSFLDVRDLAKSFGGVMALKGISFSVDAGEIVGVMGANGAGKTTLFSLIAGHQRPDRGGTIRFKDHYRLDGRRPDRVCRLGVARTFQIVRPFRGLTVLDNVTAAALFGSAERRALAVSIDRAREVLDDVGLTRMVEANAGTLTLSDQKRLEIARAIATEPELLLLDEVMAGLTPAEVHTMLETVRALHAKYNLTVLVIEHVMHALMELSRRIVVLHHGELIAIGSPSEIAEHPDVIDAYLGASR